MKRDMETIRSIMLAIQAADIPVGQISGIDPAGFAFHAQLLEEAGLVTAAIHGGGKSISTSAVIYRLTWDGHDFADSIADKAIWEKAKKHLLSPSISWTFAILREVITAEIRNRIGGLG
jgi:hypothetical protein